MLRCLVPLVLALTACSSTAKVVRLDTGQSEPVVFTPRVRGEPVKLEEGEVKRAIAQLARERRVPVAPQEAARRLFEVGERSGWYQYDPLRNRIIPLGKGAHLPTEWSAADAELTRDYLARCERRGTPGDCLHLLVESPTLTGDGRYALAMSFAEGVVLDEMEDALKGMANREAVLTAVLWTCTTYLLLLTVPEPVSKGIAAVMTAAFIAWVGLDTFWSLIVGFKHLVEEADRATTFAELRQAGERYGKVMGRNAARAFVMLATAALGSTAAGLAMKVPTLPGAAQAATQAGTQLGIRLSAVGAVTAVTVSADAVTVSVAAGAVMPMTAHGEAPAGASASAQEQGTKLARTTTAKEPPSIRSRLRDAGLPGGGESTQVGPFRYRPRDGYRPGNPLSQTDGGYVDRFGNVWRKGPYHGDPSKPFTFEWDVQLSPAGRQHFRQFGLGEKGYINVAPDGTLSH